MNVSWPIPDSRTPDPAIKAATKLLVDRLNNQLYPIEGWDDAYDLTVSMVEAYEAGRNKQPKIAGHDVESKSGMSVLDYILLGTASVSLWGAAIFLLSAFTSISMPLIISITTFLVIGMMLFGVVNT